MLRVVAGRRPTQGTDEQVVEIRSALAPAKPASGRPARGSVSAPAAPARTRGAAAPARCCFIAWKDALRLFSHQPTASSPCPTPWIRRGSAKAWQVGREGAVGLASLSGPAATTRPSAGCRARFPCRRACPEGGIRPRGRVAAAAAALPARMHHAAVQLGLCNQHHTVDQRLEPVSAARVRPGAAKQAG